MTFFRTLLIVTIAMSGPAILPSSADAKQIERACIASDRRAANTRLCSCIQSIANQLLTKTEQKVAAGFFADPHKAQELRISDNSKDESFWKRYKQFGSVASRRCS